MNPSSLTTRPREDRDEPFLRALDAEVRGAQLPPGLPEAMRSSLHAMQYAARLRSYEAAYPGTAPEIVELDGQPIGMQWVAETADALVLVDLAIAAAHRGQGAGAELVRRLQRRAADSGRRVRLQAEDGGPAMRLYLRLGFRRAGSDGVRASLEWTPVPGR